MTRKATYYKKSLFFGLKIESYSKNEKEMSCTKLMSHVASNKVQRKASTVLEIDLNFQKNSFISKTLLSLALQERKKLSRVPLL